MAFTVKLSAIKTGFFDASKIRDQVEKANAKVQSKFGAFVRQRMKSSIKYKDSKDRVALVTRIEAERAAIKDAREHNNAAAAAAARGKVRALYERLKTTTNPSAPAGAPPYAHRAGAYTRETTNKKTGAVIRRPTSPLRELIFFARDAATRSVVIGPILFGPGGAGALEKGGSVTVTRPGGKAKTRAVRAHPFARPAGEAELSKLPDLLRQMIN